VIRCGYSHSRVFRCVLELHAIAGSELSAGGRFEVAMTDKERGRFLTGVRTSTDAYYNMLGRVDAECCDCSRALDRENIREAIRSTVGFLKLNRMVIEVLEGWMEKELRQQLKAAIAVSNSDGQIQNLKNLSEWQHTLGTVLHQQGRYDESIALMETCLKLQQTLCGKDDLLNHLYTCKWGWGISLGEECNPGHHVTRLFLGECMNNLAINYRQVGRFQDALLLQEQTLHIRQTHLRQNDPQIGNHLHPCI
jgi:tetratricopeptide (TPR) repeat protein